MKAIKKKLFRLFFAVEIIVVSCIYIFGSQGIRAYLHLRNENELLQKEIATLEQEVTALEDEQKTWHANATFYCEQYAREKLHMARKDEIIYHSS